jgi:hypothetical protein
VSAIDPLEESRVKAASKGPRFDYGTFQCLAGMGAELDPKKWAHDLRKREEAGERLSWTQTQAWREVLGGDEARRAQLQREFEDAGRR